ncbi:YciI family protein [Kordiimonas sp. SCSIO 12603]|uniref:YciI family protein n=1 Tax=Kordiimonas sp. SCSIO 12603 TaxID=2829596 RepID=UPI002103D9FB|nr:YciI family protein [Kordiimonas sp. SCSIO 12603]UTW58904.1 YciI family protein [Kordiimonas sp. SCSIO 12603]
MLYVITCTDKANSVDLRMSVRPDHLAYLETAGDRLKVAGPLLSIGEDPKPIGSVIIIDAASDAAVQLFADNDPYATAGLFEKVEIKPWKAAVGVWAQSE